MVTRVRTRAADCRHRSSAKAFGAGCTKRRQTLFELEYDHKIELTLKEGLIPADFINLSRQARAGTLDEIGFKQLQELRKPGCNING